jgi:hypothetical protein
MSATYSILYSNGARTGPYGTPVRVGFHSENFPSILTLNLRPVRYDAKRSRVESGIPAACSLLMSPVAQTRVVYFEHVQEYGCCVCPLIKLARNIFCEAWEL